MTLGMIRLCKCGQERAAVMEEQEEESDNHQQCVEPEYFDILDLFQLTQR